MGLVAVTNGMMEGMEVVSWGGSGFLRVREGRREEGWRGVG